MSRKILSLFTILFIISAIAAPVYAAQTVFGPKDLTIGRWHVHLSSHRFSVDDPSEGVLTIVKNTPEKKIRGGFFFLNGKYIGLRNFLKGTGTFFEKDVNLRSNNRITVFLRGTPGASIKIEIKKKGVTPPPEVSFTAAPQTITPGESSTLTWTTTNAESVSIDQGIGNVSESGFIVVTPQETTTYTITVTGPGDTTTASTTVTVNIPAPTVSISADSATIYIGQSSNLTWTSTNANSCVIEPAIGSVVLNGSTTVSPTETTTYTITAIGPGGSAADSVTITASPPIALTITSPSDGEILSRPDVMVQGTITNASDFETGVTVNGIVAIINGDQFVANHVPLDEGENTITAIAVDIKDNTNSTSIVANAILEDYIKVTADSESGVSSFETILRVEGSFTFTESQLTYTGPGHVEILHSSADEYNVGITTEGFYDFTSEVTDSQGNTYTDTVAVLVLNEAELDALLIGKWEGMREALIQSNIDRAVSSFDAFSKDAYKEIFNALSSHLPEIAQELGDIQFIRMMKNSAEYDIRATRNGTEYSFYLLFVKDDTGLWKIRSF